MFPHCAHANHQLSYTYISTTAGKILGETKVTAGSEGFLPKFTASLPAPCRFVQELFLVDLKTVICLFSGQMIGTREVLY